MAAHTSVGKIVVVEYSFALDTKYCIGVIYTYAINTINNHNYHDFNDKFDMSLLAGDVSFSCLIMTTEIIGSMIYKGADIIRDIEWVILDEVHYVNDVE